MSIRLLGLTKRYGPQVILDDLSLEISTGELFVLLGPSGSGKSTVLRILAGLTTADAGRVVLFDQDVTTWPARRRGIGFVFQHYALFRHMTVADNVEFALRLRGVRRAERRERREELLRLVGLGGFGARRPVQLSGGQQQRVAIARALAHRPKVLLLDEPFGALDARIRSELRRSLREIQDKTGVTTIFVTHDQEEAFELGDRLAVLDQGRLLEVGRPSDLYQSPSSQFTATFLGNANLWVGEAQEGGIAVGPLRLPAGDDDMALGGDPRRVQILLRPEDLEIVASLPAAAAAGPSLGGTALGPATVREVLFSGATERVVLDLPPMPGVRAIAPAMGFGDDRVRLVALRSRREARLLPLQPGDEAWVVPRRVHGLPHPGLKFLTVGGNVARSWGQVLAAASGAALRHESQLGGFDPSTVDLVIAEGAGRAQRRGRRSLAARLLNDGAHSVLLTPVRGAEATAPPGRVLVGVAVGEPAKSDLAFAARLLRHWRPETIVCTALPLAADRAEQAAAQSFIDSGVRTLAALAVPARAVVARGEPGEALVRLAREEQADLLITGVPLGSSRDEPSRRRRTRLGGPAGEAIHQLTDVPVLLTARRR
jgi:sulfate transport system ATP-binding protein